jgi:hypothetical protein
MLAIVKTPVIEWVSGVGLAVELPPEHAVIARSASAKIMGGRISRLPKIEEPITLHIDYASSRVGKRHAELGVVRNSWR